MRHLILAVGATLALATTMAGAQARTLTDRDFELAVTFLQLEAERIGVGNVVQAGRTRYIEDAAADVQAVVAGDKDALEAARRLQPDLLVPPGGRYDAACSRVATREWDAGFVVVVYGFGVPADDVGRMIFAGDTAAARTLLEQELSARERSAEGTRVRALLDRVRNHYKANGYEAPPKQDMIFYRWMLARGSVLAIMEPINVYRDSGCEHLGDGPLLVLMPGSEVSKQHEASEERLHTEADRWSATLDRHRLTQQQWYDLRMVVMQAHDDAHATQPIEAGIEKDLLQFLAEGIAARKKNAAAYRRYAARLDPLVKVTKVEVP